MKETLQCFLIVGVFEMVALIMANVAVICLIKIANWLKAIIASWQLRRVT